MKYITLQNKEIPYQIAKKKNKNTYFYFKSEGYIQINLSTYQTEKEAVRFIIDNQDKFLRKLEKISFPQVVNPNEFLLLGQAFNVNIVDVNEVEIDSEKSQIYIPTTDMKNPVVKYFYKQEMLYVIEMLKAKYQDNKYIDISNVTYSTRYAKTRHGSCNAAKRRINLNLYLIKYDFKYIEYVFLHEITHLKHQNHGPKFYELLEKLCPKYKQLRKELREIYRWVICFYQYQKKI